VLTGSLKPDYNIFDTRNGEILIEADLLVKDNTVRHIPARAQIFGAETESSISQLI
jgi:hypothetical protein